MKNMKKTLCVLLSAVIGASFAMTAEAKTVLRYATDVSKDNTQGQGAVYFADEVKKRSNGNIEVKTFFDSTLGNSQSIVSGARSGTIDIAMVGGGIASGLSPVMAVLDIPFIFKDKEHAYRVLDGEIGDKLYATLEPLGLKGLAYFENGFRNMTNNNKPIVKPEDCAGLKIRVPQSNMLVATFKALGANPVPMAYGELYTAMETGAIDAQDHPISTLYAGKFYEIQKYLSMTKHAYTAVTVMMNKKKFDKLSKEDQQLILECARDAAKYQREVNAKEEVKMIEEMKKTGIQVNDDVDADAFMKATLNVRSIYTEKNGDEFVKLIDAERNK
jgi:tripartite ATP-independent transporter DctP family solute receptor